MPRFKESDNFIGNVIEPMSKAAKPLGQFVIALLMVILGEEKTSSLLRLKAMVT